MTESRPKILLVEDDLDVAEMLSAYLRVQEYEILMTNLGLAGVCAAQDFIPDLLILDIRLPDIDGFEVARRIRSFRRVRPVPIIFMTEGDEHANRLQGLEPGFEDFIPKPFDVQELQLRVRNALRRANQDNLTNPVTSLPDGQLLEERLQDCLSRSDWAALLISMENLDLYREAYGFVASDDVLRAVCMLITNVIRDERSQPNFLGQLNPTDFILVTTKIDLPFLHEKIQRRVDQSLDYFYPIKDREQTSMHGKRLAVLTAVVQSGEGDVHSANELKIALLQKKASLL